MRNVEPSNLEETWPPFPCETVQVFLQEAYGRLNQTGCAHAFRGVARHFENLLPSIDRRELTGDPIAIETHLLEEFLGRDWDYLSQQERYRCLLAEARWGRKRNTGAMVVARHRTVPTRCIDWSYWPLCSLFFACEAEPDQDGEVWWFNRREFDHCVARQWPALFGKPSHVEDDIERDFIEGGEREWFTALNYMLLPDDRPSRQEAWITVAGRLGKCHAKEIHRLGVREKGRFGIPARLKSEAISLLYRMGITRESLGFAEGEPADTIGREIDEDFKRRFPPRRGR